MRHIGIEQIVALPWLPAAIAMVVLYLIGRTRGAAICLAICVLDSIVLYVHPWAWTT